MGKDDEEEESTAVAARVGTADEDAFGVLLVVAAVSASRVGSETLEPAGRIICSRWTTSSSNVGLLLRCLKMLKDDQRCPTSPN